MLHIAVCDGECDGLRKSAQWIQRYLDLRSGVHARLFFFTQLQELLADIRRYDICLLSDHASGADSLKAAWQLKEKNPGMALAFFAGTVNPEAAMEAYRLGAVQYLVRPKEESEMFRLLDRMLEEGDWKSAKHIPFNSTEGVVNLRLSDVLYGKSNGHRVSFFLRGGQVSRIKCLRISFSDIVEPLLHNGFLRCHDSYVVNSAYAVRLTPEGLLLVDGTVVPVSTKKRAAIREEFRNAECC